MRRGSRGVRLRVRLRQLGRWMRANAGWLIVVFLALWTGYSLGWTDVMKELRRTQFEGSHSIWVGRNGPAGKLLLHGDPVSVAATREAIAGWWDTRCAWGAGRDGE
mgnify:FL=1